MSSGLMSAAPFGKSKPPPELAVLFALLSNGIPSITNKG
jgi:hypothetical protein